MEDQNFEFHLDYLPFKKRVLEKSQLFLVVMSIQAVVVFVIWLFTKADFFLFGTIVVMIGLLVNEFIFYRRAIFYMQSIRLKANDWLSMEIFYKDEKKILELSLQEFHLELKVNVGKGRYSSLVFYQNQNKLGTLFDNSIWTHEKLVQLFTEYKKHKNESITSSEQKMIDRKSLLW
ncbi:MAG: hypothetical protein H7A25_14385 [Leptospiraceae bacterium]|nr:hypothetical protein [Leptospiraceae bacterium]MCP5501092.1 hypothetical protein [Leptospiraceae bacterium]